MVDWWTGGGSKVNARPFGSISRPQDESEKEAKSGDDAATTCCRLLNEWKLFFYRLFLAGLNCVIAPEWPKSWEKKNFLTSRTLGTKEIRAGDGYYLGKVDAHGILICAKRRKRERNDGDGQRDGHALQTELVYCFILFSLGIPFHVNKVT